ncbi:hypothetical protein VB711_20470 [Cronbergia sp. UHCC 0137]|uniref:hypothetical protein n=1 Tax=Cronbergia sp. UHCC 0137 TaxID=3110239 RepID=UPI002B21DF53|nr:hypothetical protein [Cronbergia sp. UHCC 0137]MEA5620202.1 hypothetical protein [Cronbergia sp. UHCC 0137]
MKIKINNWTLLWILGTFSGFLGSLIWIEIGEKPDMNVLTAAIGGIAIALPQSITLKPTTFSLQWILATVVGWVVIAALHTGALGWSVPSNEFFHYRIISGTISGGIGGFLIGLTQWWIAIPKSLPSAWHWILFNSLTWAIAVPVGSVTGIYLRRLSQLFLGEVVGLAITWLLVAIFTGICAEKLLK